MKQGTLTGLAQLVAEELECDWSKVTTEYPTPGENLARNRVWGSIHLGGGFGRRGAFHDFVTCQVDAGLRYQSGQSCDEVQWFENHMRSAMPKALATLAGHAFAVRCLELVPDIAIRCQ
jgi:hypothetical protein